MTSVLFSFFFFQYSVLNLFSVFVSFCFNFFCLCHCCCFFFFVITVFRSVTFSVLLNTGKVDL